MIIYLSKVLIAHGGGRVVRWLALLPPSRIVLGLILACSPCLHMHTLLFCDSKLPVVCWCETVCAVCHYMTMPCDRLVICPGFTPPSTCVSQDWLQPPCSPAQISGLDNRWVNGWMGGWVYCTCLYCGNEDWKPVSTKAQKMKSVELLFDSYLVIVICRQWFLPLSSTSILNVIIFYSWYNVILKIFISLLHDTMFLENKS